MEKLLFVCLFCSLTLTISAIDDPVIYRIQEDQPSRTRIGDLKTDANLAQLFEEEVLSTLRFVFLGQVQNNYISLDENSGVLQTLQVLDRDKICPELEECEIQIDIGIQPAEYFEVIKVILIIEDENDHAPVFDPDTVEYSLAETTSLGQLFMIVPAKDPDSPENGISHYELVAPITDMFILRITKRFDGSIDLMSVDLLKPLDFERQDLYILKVIAIDGGSPAKSGTLTIRIKVLDINDNNPVFDEESYETSIDENSAVDVELLTIRASDPDAEENGNVEYSFSQRTINQFGDIFGIDKVTGVISLKEPLDYEVHNSYSLTVVAQDQGENSLPVSTKVLIHVNDLNDNEPMIILDETLLDDSGAFLVEEHADTEKFVAHFSVEDKDDGPNGNVNCDLQNQFFRLEKIYDFEYKVVTKMVLDRESVDSYELELKCRDLGDPSHATSAIVKVKVTDVNDHLPVFLKDVYESTISENNMVNAFINRVSASDEDIDLNGKVRYELAPDAGRSFTVDPKSGMIRSAVSFDREQNDLLSFHVLAIDHGMPERTSTAQVILHIEDRDDQAPIFSQHKYEFNVTENVPIRTKIGAVNATDYDLPPNNGFTFYLDTDPTIADLFNIDPNTGMIYNTKQLDREVQSVYRITVMVQSTEYAPMSDNCLVEITILDLNDNAPTITFPEESNNTIYVSAHVTDNHVVAIVQAFDPDYAENGSLVFELSEGNERGEFMIRPQTGEIIMKTAAEVLLATEEKKMTFPLVIKVSDQALKPRIAIETLNIVVDRTILLSHTSDKDAAALGSLHDSQLAFIIAGCFGIILVLMIILVVVFIRNRRQRQRLNRENHQNWDRKELTTVTTPSNDQLRPHDEDSKGPRPSSTASSDLGYQYTNKQDTLNKPGDSDSGCADVSHSDSQSSGEDNKPGGPPSPPLPPPPPEACNNFSDWVHNESFQLRRSGNMYRVSNNNMQRKTVRFDDETKAAATSSSHPGPSVHSSASSHSSHSPSPPPPPPPAAFKDNHRVDSPPPLSLQQHQQINSHPMVPYPSTSSKSACNLSAKTQIVGNSTKNNATAATTHHPRVHFANTLPRTGSIGSTSGSTTTGSRPTTPVVVSSSSSFSENPEGMGMSPQRKGVYADISNLNKSSHFGSRGVVVPITPHPAGAAKTGISLQGWMNPSQCGDKEGSLV